jgi:fructosamine-3-kinase
MDALAEKAAALLGSALSRTETLGGGDLSQILRIRLADGREAVVKNGPAPRVEAAMLRAIAASGAPAPAVLAEDDELLAIEPLPRGGNLSRAWASLGAALAKLHGTLGERYGWPVNYAFGSVIIGNGWSDDWPRFWAERRLLVHAGQIPSALARRIEALAADLPGRLPPRPAPSLLHGDLWGGNVLVSGDRVSALIDPACYYGHAEVDFAMLCLFDRPDPVFYDAYGPVDPGHGERLPIYQLWPALMHLRLFGNSYRPLIERLLAAARA